MSRTNREPRLGISTLCFGWDEICFITKIGLEKQVLRAYPQTQKQDLRSISDSLCNTFLLCMACGCHVFCFKSVSRNSLFLGAYLHHLTTVVRSILSCLATSALLIPLATNLSAFARFLALFFFLAAPVALPPFNPFLAFSALNFSLM